MKKYLNNEKGNGVLLTILCFGVVAMMLILITNISILVTNKEQASIAAEHASLAATSVLYEKINSQVIETYEKPVEESEEEEEEADSEEENEDSLKKKVEDRIKIVDTGLQKNEKKIQAIDDVLIEEMKEDPHLRNAVIDVVSRTNPAMDSAIRKAVADNRGKEGPLDIKWTIRDQRVVVEARTDFKSVNYNGINFGDDGDISQVGTGPEIGFLKSLGY